jgi:hypothetical protein
MYSSARPGRPAAQEAAVTAADDREDARPDGEGFLTRWSRRKTQAPPDGPPLPATAPAPAPAAAAEPDARPRDPETGEPIDEEWVASLPKIADIQPGADLSAFMRRGVPEALRREALRALWVSDPAIRDFVSPALDYAYDYNTPGAAPGYEPLTEAEIADGKRLFDRLIGADTSPAEAAASADQPATGDTESHPLRHAAASVRLSDRNPAVGTSGQPGPDAREDVPALHPEPAGETEKITQAIDSQEDNLGSPALSRRRRGGGAAPS